MDKTPIEEEVAIIKRVYIMTPTIFTAENTSVTLDFFGGDPGVVPSTVLMEKNKNDIVRCVDHVCLEDGQGFGIISGTGTGKTASMYAMICRMLNKSSLKIGIVTRKHEKTSYIDTCDVIVMTPGIAVMWLIYGEIKEGSIIFCDEAHIPSPHFEVALFLAKIMDCKFVWMSATVNPVIYQKYLNSCDIITCTSLDLGKKANIEIVPENLERFLFRKTPEWIKSRDGVIVFVETRAKAERLAERISDRFGDSIYVSFCHGGQNPSELKIILSDDMKLPYMVIMTPVGHSSINVKRLSVVVINDVCYKEVVRADGTTVLTKMPMPDNDIKQAVGRVDGRCSGDVYIVTRRRIDFATLRPRSPSFTLGGSLRYLALICAYKGINVRELELLVTINYDRYDGEIRRFKRRGVIDSNGRLTLYGERIINLPVEIGWAEMIVGAIDKDNDHLRDLVIVISCIKSLHGLGGVRQNSMMVAGSDHLTSYMIVREALNLFGYPEENDNGVTIYKLMMEDFEKWCVLQCLVAKEIVNVLMAIKSVYRRLEIPLPQISDFPSVFGTDELSIAFVELLARAQSLDLMNNNGFSIRRVKVPKHSVLFERTSGDSVVIGTIRYYDFKGDGEISALIEGTKIPNHIAIKYFMDGNNIMSYDGEPVFISDRQSLPVSPLKTKKVEKNLGMQIDLVKKTPKVKNKSERKEERRLNRVRRMESFLTKKKEDRTPKIIKVEDDDRAPYVSKGEEKRKERREINRANRQRRLDFRRSEKSTEE